MGIVKYLLDTHTLLWVVSGNQRLSDAAEKAINDESSLKFVSAVSAYEIMYKYKLGKLQGFENIAANYLDMLKKFGALELPISTDHAHFAGKFEWSHRDPFDRMLAAQTSIENMTLITSDEAFQSLPWVSVLW
ncbi:MAG: type II toxin-antitoxin system VapC family toxin [Oscillospiraceae bacterium]|nr:type II toxin-antitoxin system VapC family toxin [Oscillospiraceae bacterium]